MDLVGATPASLGAFSFYAGCNAFILVWLAVATSRVRLAEKVSIGDGGNLRLIRAMRGHANAVEVIPIALILMLALALLGLPAWVLHGLGLPLTAGRIFHALHFIAADAPRWQRAAGTALSYLVIIAAGATAVILGLLSFL